jgi:hypothetical protein
MVKFGAVAAFAFFLASCYSDVPELPKSKDFKICKYTDAQGKQCKSTYVISEEDCIAVGGTLVEWNLESCED